LQVAVENIASDYNDYDVTKHDDDIDDVEVPYGFYDNIIDL